MTAAPDYPTSIVRTDGQRDLKYARRFLRLHYVGVAWNLFSPSNHSDSVTRTSGSLTPAHLALLTRIAEADGLGVVYRPLIKLEGPKQWEGYVAPANTAAWFNSYFKAEFPYLQIAQKYHVREFVVGTELVQLEQSAPASQWKEFLAKAAHVYHGTLSYASWGGDYYPAHRKLPPTSLYGMTAYPDFRLPNSASVQTLTKSWIHEFRMVPLAVRERTAIQEIGIPAGNGAYDAPWAWNRPYVLNQTVQYRWFLSACYAARALRLRGIYFWNLNLTNNPHHPPWPSPVTFEGKRGALAIRKCVSILH